MENFLDSAVITAVATALLVAVGAAQYFVLVAQKRQASLSLATVYQTRWKEARQDWGKIVFIGREAGEYYQVVSGEELERLGNLVQQSSYSAPTVWALESIQAVCGIMSEVCLRILQGQLSIQEAYPIFDVELLRHSKPLRNILDSKAFSPGYPPTPGHDMVRNEVRDWLVYHDGIRRRCLILVDLLWAEAVRLEDLSPGDSRSAAEAKSVTGHLNKRRVFSETFRLNGIGRILSARRLARFLKYAEYASAWNWRGINKKKLDASEKEWVDRLLPK